MKNTLNKEKIDTVFSKGKWVNSTVISAVYVTSDSFEYMVSAPIKKFKKATDRNRIKRLLRQGIFTNETKNINIAFIYKADKIVEYALIESNIKDILNRINVSNNI